MSDETAQLAEIQGSSHDGEADRTADSGAFPVHAGRARSAVAGALPRGAAMSLLWWVEADETHPSGA